MISDKEWDNYYEADEVAFYQLFAGALIDGVLGEAPFNHEAVIANILQESAQISRRRFTCAKRHFVLMEKAFEKDKIREEFDKADQLGVMYNFPTEDLIRCLSSGFSRI